MTLGVDQNEKVQISAMLGKAHGGRRYSFHHRGVFLRVHWEHPLEGDILYYLYHIERLLRVLAWGG